MAINFKPINEVPVAEELAEGDTLLINSGGTAKQIDATKVGGSGGGTVIYIKGFAVNDDTGVATGAPFKDAEMMQVMSTAELLETFAAGTVVLYVVDMGFPAWLTPILTTNMPDEAIMSMLLTGAEVVQFVYLCSDTDLS